MSNSPCRRPSEPVYEAFRSLLRSALWGAEEPSVCLSSGQWQELYGFSQRQAVLTLLFDAVKTLPSGPDITLAAKWLMNVDDNERQYRKNESAIRDLSEVWNTLKLDFCTLKGLEAAKLYPVPEHRLCGDVDWYFKTRKHRRTADCWAKENASDAGYDSDNCLHYCLSDVVMEHHLLTIDPEDKAALLGMYTSHILKHAMVMGIGFRQFCDLALAYKHYKGNYSAEKLREELKRKGELRWSALLNAFLVRETGLDAADLPDEEWKKVPDKDIDSLLRLVIEDGNFGLQKDRRLSGFSHRTGLFLRYAPGRFFCRWLYLSAGRVRNIFRK